MAAEIQKKMQTTGSMDSKTTSIMEEWYITGDSLIECCELLRPYRNTRHPDNSAYRVTGISYSKEGFTGGLVQVIATVTYSRGGGSSSPVETDDAPTFSFSAGGGSKRVFTGKTLKTAASPEADYVPAPGNFVGWNGRTGQDFHVEGVDVPTAQIKESWEKEFKMSQLTTKWRRKVATMIGKFNSKPFKGWEAGEVLFIDCSFQGVADSSEKIKVKFDFAINPNEEDAVIGGLRMGNKAGWDYAWVIPMQHQQEGNPIVAGAYISQVMDMADLNELGV